jgi:sec-independent protein translocase protein TatB
MLDIGWSEMGLILLVALVVIGPKDLPRVARTVGKWSAKARGMARSFSARSTTWRARPSCRTSRPRSRR